MIGWFSFSMKRFCDGSCGILCSGVSDLYVHVIVDNLSARKLYEKAGFVYEKEETVKEARSNCRPQRYLLRAQL
jgi:ribosomal protein S18 acetylase RimI-like enzyme